MAKISPRQERARATAQEKWGVALDQGFQILPNLLVRTQHHLGLTPLDVVVLLNLNLHWWKRDDLPFPRPAIIANRVGVTRRTVERSLQRLEKKGFIRRLPPERLRSGSKIRKISLDGLVEKLSSAAGRSMAASEYRRLAAEAYEKD